MERKCVNCKYVDTQVCYQCAPLYKCWVPRTETAIPVILTKLINTTDPIFLPQRKYSNDGGADLRARIDKPIRLYPQTIVKIPTGCAVEIPSSYVGLIQPRSGASSVGKLVITGTIDSSYRGEMLMSVINPLDNGYVEIEPRERLGQLVIVPVLLAEFVQVDELSEGERGVRGFGSSGKF